MVLPEPSLFLLADMVVVSRHDTYDNMLINAHVATSVFDMFTHDIHFCIFLFSDFNFFFFFPLIKIKAFGFVL